MTITEGYQFIRNSITRIYDLRESGNIAALVIEKITGMRNADRIFKKEQELSSSQEALLKQYVSLLLTQMPVQYVLEEAWFYGMPFYVDENVLIPRPETEELVDWIIRDERLGAEQCKIPTYAGTRREASDNEQKKEADQHGESYSLILDIGTGSGCIAIALKKNLPNTNVYAIDISEEALFVAQKNAGIRQTPIQFLNLDILNPAQSEMLPLFNIIISNPPYIPLNNKFEMNKNVTHFEPHTALFVKDEDPLLFYTTIAHFSLTHLKKKGRVYLEIHESMGEKVRQIFAQHGFEQTIVRKDMQGKDRMIKATFSN